MSCSVCNTGCAVKLSILTCIAGSCTRWAYWLIYIEVTCRAVTIFVH